MTIICSPSLLPTYDDLHDLLSPFYPDFGKVVLPIQQTLPDPVWPTINNPQQELENTITEMMKSQGSGLINELLTVLTDFLGLDIGDILPDIPGFPGFNFINILNNELQDMIDLVVPGFDFSLIGLLPDPIYPRMNVPNWQALTAVQTAISQYYQILTGTISDLIALVTDQLQLPGLPTLPTFPTLAEIQALLPAAPVISDLFSISIPGFVFQLSMPQPLIPSINIPSVDFQQGLNNLYAGLSTEVLGIIIDFVDGLPLSFDFPIFCLTITVTS